MKFRVAFLALLLLTPASLSAQEPVLTPITDRAEAVALLAEYAGEWTGRGESRSDFDAELEAASCRLTTIYDVESVTLTNDGVCANAVRRIDIDGFLGLTETGELTGGYFGRFEQAELLSSVGHLYEEGFVVEARYRLQLRGQVQEIDVVVRVDRPLLNAAGRAAFSMVVEVRNPETNEFVQFSSFVFTRNIA